MNRRNGLPFTELQSYASALRAAFPAAVLYYNEAWPALVPTMPGAGQYVGTMGAIPDAQLLRSVPKELDWFSVYAQAQPVPRQPVPDKLTAGGCVAGTSTRTCSRQAGS